jgi:hypothetical protein
MASGTPWYTAKTAAGRVVPCALGFSDGLIVAPFLLRIGAFVARLGIAQKQQRVFHVMPETLLEGPFRKSLQDPDM